MAKLSNRYATAFFELAVERGELDALAAQAALVKDAFYGEEFRGVMSHPDISKEEKFGFVETALNALFPSGVNADFKGFLHLLIAKNRENIIVDALEDFAQMADEHNKKAAARVVSAVPLSDAQIAALKAALLSKTGKNVDFGVEVDASLIGGLYVNIDGLLLDYSVKHRLDDMRKSIS